MLRRVDLFPQICSSPVSIRLAVPIAAALSFLLIISLFTILSRTLVSVDIFNSQQAAYHFETDNASSSRAKIGNGELLSVSTLSDAYLGFLDIDEQLSSNSRKFIQLCYLSILWNFSIVEPWILKDTLHLTSIPTKKGKSNLLFAYLYDQTKVEKRLSHCLGVPGLTEFHFHNLSDALIQSSRDVLIVRFMRKTWSAMGKAIGECSDISKNRIKDVLNRLNSGVEDVKEEAQRVHKKKGYKFRMWKTICITAKPGVPFSINNVH